MPFCATCGSQVEGRFCAKCGTPVAAGAPGPGTAAAPPPPVQPGYAPPPPGYAPPVAAMPANTSMADNVAGALCYVLGLITGIIFLVLAPYNQNKAVRFHAFQSIFLNVAVIAIDIVFSIVFGIMMRIAGIFFIGALVWPIFGLCCFILWLVMMIQTYQGKTIVLPVIGNLARQQA